MSNIELVEHARMVGDDESYEEMTQRNLHTVRQLCEKGQFDKAIQWLKERGER